MHYKRHYTGPDRKANDERAVSDIREYLSPEQWEVIHGFASHPGLQAKQINDINMGFAMIGVSGYPFHAFCRTYCLAQYREWMNTGEDAVATDEDGFALEEEV